MDSILSYLAVHYNEFKAATNIAVAAMMFIISFSVAYYWRLHLSEMKTPLRMILLGVAIEAFGWGLHRLYWSMDWIDNFIPGWNFNFGPESPYWWVGDIPIYLAGLGAVFIVTPIIVRLKKPTVQQYIKTASIIIAFTASLFILFTSH